MDSKNAIQRLRTHGQVWVNIFAASAIAMAASQELNAEVTRGAAHGDYCKLTARYSISAMANRDARNKVAVESMCDMHGIYVKEYPHYIQVKHGMVSRSLRSWTEVYEYIAKTCKK